MYIPTIDSRVFIVKVLIRAVNFFVTSKTMAIEASGAHTGIRNSNPRNTHDLQNKRTGSFCRPFSFTGQPF